MLTDPTKKPDGTKLEEPPVPVDHESVEKPAEPEPDPGQPQAGDTSGNQIMFLDLDGLRTMGEADPAPWRRICMRMEIRSASWINTQ